MNSDDHKQQYKNTVYVLNIINKKVGNLSSNLVDLSKMIKKNVEVDKKGLCEEELSSIRNELENISVSIENRIIPSLYGKIYE